MNRSILKRYAPQARRDFIQAVTDRASYYGLTKKKTEPVTAQGDTALIGGRAFPKKVGEQRKRLEERVAQSGFEQVMEAVAYTWFNRLVAIRFMELHGYLEHGYRVLSHPSGGNTPEILEHADSLDLPGLDPQQVIELKLAGDKDAELYRMLLIAQCNALHSAMPFLFERIDDETELLLPDNLLHSDSLIRTLVSEIPEEDWQEVEIIGWLYQFYISEKKDQVIGKVVKSEDIPAATQLFTPNWIVKYLVQNSLGRQWVATYPNSPLKGEMEYYIEPAEQTPEVQEQLKAITPGSLDPEELTLLDPACGSGHILVEAYDLLKAIYQERGYPKKDIPRLILTKNLYGLEIDDRAAQLAAFALMMKARADDRRIFAQGIQPHVLSIQESKGLDAKEITEALNASVSGNGAEGNILQADLAHLIDLFEHGKTVGSLIRAPEELAERLPSIAQRVEYVLAHGGILEKAAVTPVKLLVELARLLSGRYGSVVMNPPYMASLPGSLKSFANVNYPETKADLYSMFIERAGEFAASKTGVAALVTMHSWMFLDSFEAFRTEFLKAQCLTSLAHLGPRAFAELSGEVVQVAAFAVQNLRLPSFRPVFFRLIEGSAKDKEQRLRSGSFRLARRMLDDFTSIPGSPLAYWISDALLDVFKRAKPLGDVAPIRSGMSTTNNQRFLRIWHEVRHDSIGFGCIGLEDAAESGKKWFPYRKGGDAVRWYGDETFVLNWGQDGREIKHAIENNPNDPNTTHWSRRIYGTDYFFKPCATWSKIATTGFSVRLSGGGSICSDASNGVFPRTVDDLWVIGGLLNSVVAEACHPVVSATLNTYSGDIAKIPYLEMAIQEIREPLASVVSQIVDRFRWYWNRSESSWHFESPRILDGSSQISRSIDFYLTTLEAESQGVAQLEKQVDSMVAVAYGLEAELSVPPRTGAFTDTPLSLLCDLISYAIGCMMGRYSLNSPGLIYAHSGGDGFDPSQYQTFPADSDGIVPITEFEWFEDDAANRLEEFIATAWPKDHLEENLKFIAGDIGQKKSETARDAVRRYLSTGFYKHHLSLYKKRPIYWLFSSGKQRAFQCLVYLHRYNPGTLSRMRTEYVIPLQGKIESRIDQLELDIEAASSTSHQKKLTKERDTLVKHREELQTFDEKLRHYADQRITLDLDDGVKANYGKFGDLLAEVKAVTGQKAGE